jgi:putative ABC transport system permease protein
VSPGYLKALSIPLLAGRFCDDVRADFAESKIRDVMVNRAFVERFAPGRDLNDVVGRRLDFAQQGGGSFQIVGVAGDVREDGPAAAIAPYVYTCLAAGSWPDPEYVVRAAGDSRAAIRQLVKTLDPSRPVFGVKPLADVTEAALDQPRLNAAALGTFAAAALVLAALGLYGLLMLLVSQRRRELGVRMALGARPRDLARVIVSGAGRLVATGLATGLVLTLIAGYLLRALLFGIGPFDPGALAGAVLALALAALAAIVVPARQAAAVTAMDAMRLD